jgi:hypothetical protein
MVWLCSGIVSKWIRNDSSSGVLNVRRVKLESTLWIRILNDVCDFTVVESSINENHLLNVSR